MKTCTNSKIGLEYHDGRASQARMLMPLIDTVWTLHYFRHRWNSFLREVSSSQVEFHTLLYVAGPVHDVLIEKLHCAKCMTYHVQPMNIIGRQVDHMTNGEPSYGHLTQR